MAKAPEIRTSSFVMADNQLASRFASNSPMKTSRVDTQDEPEYPNDLENSDEDPDLLEESSPGFNYLEHCVNRHSAKMLRELMKKSSPMLASLTSPACVFQPHCKKEFPVPVVPSFMEHDQEAKYVEFLTGKLKEYLSPSKVFDDPYYGPKIAKRVEACIKTHRFSNKAKQVQYGSWLHFDEFLRCNSIKKQGIYDCVAHYPLLVKAIKRCNFLGYCPYSSRVYIKSPIK